jgi:hypothetical protein
MLISVKTELDIGEMNKHIDRKVKKSTMKNTLLCFLGKKELEF